MTISQNFVYEKDFHCASKTVVDVNNMKLAEAYGVFAWMNTGHGNWYFRSNCLNKMVGLGCNYSINDKMHHATELQYDFNKKTTGIYGQPLFWRWGANYHL
jgi:histidinol phosphatase-like PHP family hydrolase